MKLQTQKQQKNLKKKNTHTKEKRNHWQKEIT